MQALAAAFDPETRDKLRDLFRSRRFDLETADDPRTAVERVAAHCFQFVLVDLARGGDDALELCRAVRRHHGQSSYLLAAPKNDSAEALRAAFAAGVDDFLPRPITRNTLQTRLAVGQRHLSSRLSGNAERRLEVSVRSFRTLVETMNEGFFRVDEHGIIQAANSRLAEITGFTQAELVGQSADELLVDPEVRQRLPGQTLLGTGIGSERYSLPLHHKSGETVWASLTAAPMPHPEGGPPGAVGLVDDISRQREAEEGLQFREEYFRVLLESASDLITIIDLEGIIRYQNSASERLLGYTAESLRGREIYTFLHETDRQRLRATLQHALQGSRATASVQLRMRHREEHWRYLESHLDNMVDNPVVGGVVITSRDVTERRRIEAALKRERAFFQQLFTNSPAGIVILDHENRVVDANRAFTDLFQWEIRDMEGRPIDEMLVPDHLRDEGQQLTDLVYAKQNVARETIRQRKDGTAVDVSILGFPVELSESHLGVFALYTDITERKNAERKLFHDAFHDALTGLPNRTLVTERIARDLRRQERNPNYRFALLFIDLDGFKAVNDQLGHAAGDDLLVGVARRLEAQVRPSDTVARLGGDEFTILLEDLEDPLDAARIAESSIEALEVPFPLGEQEGNISASIGIAYSTPEHSQVDDIMREADTAMYRAKTRGKACYEIFDAEMHAAETERLALEVELKQAFEAKDQLLLHYQPIISLTTRRMVGLEAFVRWQHPTLGLMEPRQVLATCEDAGLYFRLAERVFQLACRQLAKWQKRFPDGEGLLLHLNFSGAELLHPEFLQVLDSTLKKRDLRAGCLAIEVQEASLVEHLDTLPETLWELHRRGFRLVLDNFAAKTTSLSALARLPIDSLKLGGPFIGALEPGEDKLEVVRSVLVLGESLGIRVIAERVEEEKQLQLLRQLGCGFAQGFYFSQALPAEGIVELLLEERLW